MYDGMLAAALLAPLGLVAALGRWLQQGLAACDIQQQAGRKYLLSWSTLLALLAQFAGLWWLLATFGDDMPLLAQAWYALLLGARWVGQHSAPWVATMGVAVLTMGLLVLYFVALYAPLQRLDRAIKQLQGAPAQRLPTRLAVRGMAASLVPTVLWLGVVFAFPIETFSEPQHLVPLLAAYLLLMHSAGPWLIELGYPTSPLPPQHPVHTMAQVLADQAGVRVQAVRVLHTAHTHVANALVSGLWPGLRRIYITDHMLDTFTVDEIRAVLAHEVGHVRHRHLWWYAGLALAGALLIPLLGRQLQSLAGLQDAAWVHLLAFGLYWSVAFKFLSRRFELQADRFAVRCTGDVAVFQQALEKLAQVNAVVRQYARWDIFQTHPPIAQRVRAVAQGVQA